MSYFSVYQALWVRRDNMRESCSDVLVPAPLCEYEERWHAKESLSNGDRDDYEGMHSMSLLVVPMTQGRSDYPGARASGFFVGCWMFFCEES